MYHKNKIAIFLAARSGSKRLPNKHFLKLNNKLKVIDLCILRLKKSKLVKKIFLCTTKKKEDDKFKKVCISHKINFFRGNEKNVAHRIIQCAKENNIKTIVRITADCPLIDPSIIDICIKIHFKKNNDYTSNILKLSFPDGLDVEVVQLNALIKSQEISKTKFNKEHVTHYIRKSNSFRKFNYKNNFNYSDRRWTLDNFKDYIYIKKVLEFFSPKIYFNWKYLIKAEQFYSYLINRKRYDK